MKSEVELKFGDWNWKKTYSHNLLKKCFWDQILLNEMNSVLQTTWQQTQQTFWVNVRTIIYIRFLYIIFEDLLDSLQNVIRERRNFWLFHKWNNNKKRGHPFMTKEKQKYSLNSVFYLTLSLKIKIKKDMREEISMKKNYFVFQNEQYFPMKERTLTLWQQIKFISVNSNFLTNQDFFCFKFYLIQFIL